MPADTRPQMTERIAAMQDYQLYRQLALGGHVRGLPSDRPRAAAGDAQRVPGAPTT